MAIFSYKARDERGSLIAGTMDADNHRAVSSHLDSMGLFPVAVAEKKGMGSFSFDQLLTKMDRVKLDDIIFFTRQLRTVIKAGVPLISGLKALEEQTNSRKLKVVIKKVWQDLDRGQSFSDALTGYPDVFSDLFVSMVKAGEIGGVLDEVLERLALLLEFQMKTKEMFKSALRYPTMVVGAIVIAFAVLVTFVIPKFALLFKGSTMKLPLPTRILLMLNELVQAYGVLLLAGGISCCYRRLSVYAHPARAVREGSIEAQASVCGKNYSQDLHEQICLRPGEPYSRRCADCYGIGDCGTYRRQPGHNKKDLGDQPENRERQGHRQAHEGQRHFSTPCAAFNRHRGGHGVAGGDVEGGLVAL